MTNKEIAAVLRRGQADEQQKLADELDPPRPEPGTVVWWQDTEGLSDPTLGMVNEFGCIEIFGTTKELEFDEVTWKPARILAPDEVAFPLGVAKAIAGEQSHYNQRLYTAFAVEARATLAKQIAIAEVDK